VKINQFVADLEFCLEIVHESKWLICWSAIATRPNPRSYRRGHRGYSPSLLRLHAIAWAASPGNFPSIQPLSQ